MVQPSSTRSSLPSAKDTAGVSSPIKITVVGDDKVGKTCMVISLLHKLFPDSHVPKVIDHVEINMQFEQQNYSLALLDTADREDDEFMYMKFRPLSEYSKFRPLSYENTQCFFLCFSVNNKESYVNIHLKWIPEIRKHCPDTSIVLVGTKVDLRQESDIETSTEEDGKKLADEIGAFDYVECSAKELLNLDTILTTAIRAVVHQTQTKRIHSCNIL